ncbi:GSCOCT00014278001.2-RA-CDS [Cotesia congregata]|uniref:Cc_single_2.3b n=2 Tax=root TaxID=1 RepID=S6CWG7_COTCN|nr:GSCOCT00014278001.2-RA-CDS [Cotesia congregata]CAG5092381.1 cc_single_2.3b [Cotesia congregata]CBZ06023.1 hypothetical protein CcBV_2.3B [Bracoviriform congregatae]CCQ71151.1 hypothetical protein CcBV_2.3B [Cotesia congregata]
MAGDKTDKTNKEKDKAGDKAEYCGLCCRQISDTASAESTRASCKHIFHTLCIKVRYCLQTKADAKAFVAVKCPVCPLPTDSAAVLAQINAKLDLLTTMNDKLTGLTERVDKLQDTCGTLNDRVTKLEAEGLPDIGSSNSAAFIKQVADQVSSTVKASSDINDEIRQLQLESTLLNDQFVVSGFKEDASEDLLDMVVRLGSMMGVPDLNRDRFQYADRIGKKGPGARCREIVVKCKSPQTVNNFIAVRRDLKELTANVIIPGMPRVPIYVSRRYPQSLYKLRRLLIEKYPAINKRSTWIASTCVCVRPTVGSEPIKAYPSTDLDHIQELFRLHRNDRRLRHGGGVALFVKNTLSSRVVACSSNLSDFELEYIAVELVAESSRKILVCVIYRPPRAALFDAFEQDFDRLLPFYNNIVIIGDLAC